MPAEVNILENWINGWVFEKTWFLINVTLQA